MAHLVVLLADGFEEVEAITVIDLLRRAGVTVTTAGVRKAEVPGGHGITVVADTTLRHLPDSFDGIVLPGGGKGTQVLAGSEAVIDLVKKSFADGLLCAAICAAPSVFGKAGILRNMRATCYPGFEDQLTGARFIEAAVVRDKNIITGRGVTAAIPFALELIAQTAGTSTAERVAGDVLYS